MKAVLCPRYGPPDSLRIADVPRPVPGPSELLVAVHCASVTRTDTATLRGHPAFARLATGLLRPRHRIAGLEFAGEVIGAGRAVTRFRAGDRVFGLSPTRFGAQAEYIALAETGAVARIPDNRPFGEAVLCEGAWYAAATVRRLSPGQTLLVYGASGAIGSAAVMLARAKGARVTAAVEAHHLDFAATLGAQRVVACKAIDEGRLDARFDIVFDAVGKTSYFACRRLIAPGGQYCATDLGPWWSNIWLAFLRKIPGAPHVDVPFPEPPEAVLPALSEAMRSGAVWPVIDRSFPLEQAVEAYRYVETGRKRGVVLLEVVPRAG